ncbi:MAG TPA: asparagine synthase C-terminal domain-containing protein [Solirubrobacteraceae bacterium]|nr:asparagine synthase C-terminal domain-containing protein [Solirubrobacteraceae bacterium]
MNRPHRLAPDDGWLHEPWPHERNASGITRLELVCGWVTGLDPRGPDIADVDPLADPLDALDRALIGSLQQAPCCVAFSGGRDSSVLLALATRLARREGLPEPIALTMRWPGLPETDESDWQEQVVTHLGIRDWQILEPDDDLDLVGAVAGPLLLEHGLTWPPAAHVVLPLQRAATGGVLVMGDGGDQIFAGWRRARLGDLLAGRRRAQWRDVLRALDALAPTPLRALADSLRADTPAPWLSPPTLRAWRRHQGSAAAQEPATWPAFLRWTRRERATVLTLDTWERIGRGVGSGLSTPFWDPVFLRSLGVWGGRFGRGQRTPLMAALFSDLLPDTILRRTTKAHFTRAFFSHASRRFAEGWSGPAPESPIVDARSLRETWLTDLPPNTSAVLLQASWLLGQATPATPPAGQPAIDG